MGLYGDADLVMTQDVAYTRSLQYLVNDVAIDWSLYTVTIQIRDRIGTLTGDLSQYAAPRSGDHTHLDINVPRAAINSAWHDCKWDLVAVLTATPTTSLRTPIPPGRVLVLPGVTDV